MGPIKPAELEDFLVSSTLSHSEMMNVTQLRKGSEVLLSSSGPNVKVKSKLGPEIGFVMGWPTTTTTTHHITFFEL